MAGYTRQSVADIVNGANITAPPLNAEFNTLAAAFDGTTGHTHTGGIGDGPKIELTTSVSGYLPQVHGGVGGKNNTQATVNPTSTDDANSGYAPGSVWINASTGRLFICMVNSASAAVWVEAMGIIPQNRVTPENNNTVDIGSPTLQFKDIYIDGTGYIDAVSGDTLTLTSTATVGGSLTVTGATTGSTLTLTSNASVGGSLSVTGNTTIAGDTYLNGNTVIGNTTSDTVNVNATISTNLVPTTDNSRDLGTTTNEWRNLYLDGTANIDSLVADTADINAGTIDATAIGTTTPAQGAFTNITATGTTTSAQTIYAQNGLSVQGTTIIGSLQDTVAVNAAITSHLIPSGTSKNLGSSTVGWNTAYVGTDNTVTSNIGTANVGALNVTNASALNTVTATGITTGSANVTSSATIATADINSGTIDNTAIGSTTRSTGKFTTLDANAGITGNLTGDVTGDVTGNLTGNVTGNVTGNITGNVTGDLAGNVTSTGTSTFNNVAISGTLNMDAGTAATIQNLTDPTNLQDAATKNYVDSSISNLIDGAPATLDTLNELAAALADDANAYTTLDNKINTKVSKAGDTMTGDLDMGANKVTTTTNPTTDSELSRKGYVDAQDALKVSKAGDTMSGVLNMGSNLISALATPVSDTDAATKAYVDVVAGSADAAAASATAAATSASEALASKTAAGVSEGNAAASESAAATSEANAATSEANADDAESDARKLATNPEDSQYTLTDSTTGYSALHYAAKAEDSATSSATSAAASSISAGQAATSATNSANSATASANSATASAASATASASSASQAAASAAQAAATYDAFDDRYLGSKTSDPTVDNDGNPLVAGALYFNSTESKMRAYDGSTWIDASSAVESVFAVYNYTATEGQTTFTGADDNSATLAYTAPNLFITLNGVVLENGTDYTATTGNSVVLTAGATAGDEVNIYAIRAFSVADTVSASTGGTFYGNVAHADNVKATFGNSNDFQVYHDSTSGHTYLRETGPGSTVLQTNTFVVQNAAGTQNIIMAPEGSSGIDFSYNGSTKLSTTSTGVNVTGAITVNGAPLEAGAKDGVFWENEQTITSNYTITSGKNAGTFGPVTIADGVTVTIPDGSTWTVV
jgi:hypothetical protein